MDKHTAWFLWYSYQPARKDNSIMLIIVLYRAAIFTYPLPIEQSNDHICYAYYYLINSRFEQFPDSNILWKEVASFTDALESEVMDQHGKFLTGL